MASSYPYLNDLERQCLTRHFAAYSAPGRAVSKTYPDDIVKGLQVRLEALSMTDGRWALVKKEEGLCDPNHVTQLVMAQNLTFFDAMHELAQFEAVREQAGVCPLDPDPSGHYRKAAEAGGLVFDAGGLPHPTDCGLIVGNAVFPKDACEKAEATAAARLAARGERLLEAIGAPRLQTPPVYFNEVQRLEDLVAYMAKANAAMRALQYAPGNLRNSARQLGMDHHDLGGALGVFLTVTKSRAKDIVSGELLGKTMEPGALNWLTRVVTTHAYLVRLYTAKFLLSARGSMKTEDQVYTSKCMEEAAKDLGIVTGLSAGEALKAVQRHVMDDTPVRKDGYGTPEDIDEIMQWMKEFRRLLIDRSLEKPATMDFSARQPGGVPFA